MKIYNSMTRKKEEFKPIEEGNVKMYACGITVYDLSHIGHARQAIVYSMIAEYLRFRGYNVKYVRNYTDVDDKIINRANILGKDPLDFSKEQIKEAEIDMKELHVKDADVKPKASENIDNIIKFVQGLIKKGYAYESTNGDVYYIVRKFNEYGKLSNRNIDELINGVRKDVEVGKKDPLDFALWKAAKPGEISWNSPWGKGRPGWHIECSAMALNELGEMIDIHGGGKDLIFPHHENEIAQSEALNGKTFAKYWSHCGLIKINGEKMSKSLGNSLTIRDALKRYDYEVIKYVFMQKHYTTDIDILDNDFIIAEEHLNYFYNTLKQVKDIKKEIKENSDIDYEVIKDLENKFIQAMDDDFNTTIVISELFNIFKYINNQLSIINKENKEYISNTLIKLVEKIKQLYNIIGLFTHDEDEYIDAYKNKKINDIGISREEIEQKIKMRNEFKEKKDYKNADRIRNELLDNKIILNDTREGTSWNIK